jgi:hypothetical protein
VRVTAGILNEHIVGVEVPGSPRSASAPPNVFDEGAESFGSQSDAVQVCLADLHRGVGDIKPVTATVVARTYHVPSAILADAA